jgi:dihydrofolate synthase/folylpolyglutamate synthase
LSYEDAVRWLYDLSKKERSGMRLGLKSIRGLCEKVGDPQDAFDSIHVAGTNGKGSVAHMIEAVLRVSGKRTGLYTSPHLQTFCERVMVEGKMITEAEIVEIAKVLFPHVEAMGFEPTFFDVTTALAFMHFKNGGVERAVVEVGLGGRLDSTNVLEKVDVCVLTNVGLEHTDVLGDDVSRIAMEKASIFKEGALAVVGDVPEEAMDEVRSIANRMKVKGLERGARLEIIDERADGTMLRVFGKKDEYDVRLPLLGRAQARNAALAVAALESMEDGPSKEDIETGLSKVEVPGRLEVVSRRPLVLIDGAHNVPAGIELGRTVNALFGDRRVVLVVGMMKDKDIAGFLRALAPSASIVIATRADSKRAVMAEDIVRHAGEMFDNVLRARTVEGAVKMAQDTAGPDGIVLVTGSFYVAGEARQVFKPVDRTL